MNNNTKDLEILNTMPDEEWSADGMRVLDSDGVEVAETQDIEDARYIAHFDPKVVRDMLNQQIALQQENEQLRIHYESEKRRADDRAAENDELSASLSVADAKAQTLRALADQLAAHVERLSEALKVYAWSDAATPEGFVLIKESDMSAADVLLSETPAQSLQAIKAEVEEEMVERHSGAMMPILRDMISRGQAVDAIKSMPRKYSKC